MRAGTGKCLLQVVCRGSEQWVRSPLAAMLIKGAGEPLGCGHALASSSRGRGVAYVLRHHSEPPRGIEPRTYALRGLYHSRVNRPKTALTRARTSNGGYC